MLKSSVFGEDHFCEIDSPAWAHEVDFVVVAKFIIILM
jgi:hypothetical protein